MVDAKLVNESLTNLWLHHLTLTTKNCRSLSLSLLLPFQSHYKFMISS